MFLKLLTLEIKTKVKLWEIVIDERKIHFETLECFSETLTLVINNTFSCSMKINFHLC